MKLSFNELNYKDVQSPLSDFDWKSIDRVNELIKLDHLDINIRQLKPDKFSYPYHYHRNAEEVMVILSGELSLRTPKGVETVKTGDVLIFEKGESGAHQLYNHTQTVSTYLDLSTNLGFDVCEYPDSNKINILPERKIIRDSNTLDYYDGEEGVRDIWQSLKDKER